MDQRSLFFVFLTVLLCFPFNSESKVIINTINGTQIEIDSLEIVYIGSDNILREELLTAEISTNEDDVANKIFMVRTALPADERVVEMQNKGALGFICGSITGNVPGNLRWRWSNKEAISQIGIPVHDMASREGLKLLDLVDSGQILNVTLMPNGDLVNQWEPVFNNAGFYIWTAILAMFPASNIGLAIWKLCQFYKYYAGCRAAVSTFVLAIEVMSNILRLIIMIDPFATHFIFPSEFCISFYRLSFPFACSAFLLITLYWHEMMTSYSLVVHPFVVKMKIPFIVGSSVLLSIQLVQIFLRSIGGIEGMQLATAVIYTIVVICIVTFYLITGIKLLKRLSGSKSLGRAVRLRKTTVKILISAGFLIAFVGFGAMFVSGFVYYPNNFVSIWYSIWTLLNAASMMNILAFELPRGNSSKGPSGSSSKVTVVTTASTPSSTDVPTTPKSVTVEV
jgi:hypothetical protein